MEKQPAKVNLAEKFDLIKDCWSPKVAGQVNDVYIKLVRLDKREFDWHSHENEDEMFFIVKGKLLIRLQQEEILLEPGEFLVVPKGVEHQPVAREEVLMMLVEPKQTKQTGDKADAPPPAPLEWV